ncbi:class I SAM-dependent methyltransferase [Candidatus Omnitrophota bacterium]
MKGLESVTCNICGRDDALLYSAGGGKIYGMLEEFNLVRCRNCGLFYINPRPTRDSIKRYYPLDYPEYRLATVQTITDYLTRHAFKYRIVLKILATYYGYQFSKSAIRKGFFDKIAFIDKASNDRESEDAMKRHSFYHFIRRFIYFPLFFIFNRFFPYIPRFKRDGNFLDVGCGRGVYLYLLKTWGWNAYAVEPSKETAENVINNLGVDVFNGVLEESNFKDNFFDVVNLNHVLEHVHDPTAILQTISRILKEDGLLMIRVPNAWSLPGYIIGKKLAMVEDLPRHLFVFDRITIRRLLQKAKFEIINIRFDPLPRTITGCYKFLLPRNSLGFLVYERLEKIVAPILACCFFLTSVLPIGNSMTIWARKRLGDHSGVSLKI